MRTGRKVAARLSAPGGGAGGPGTRGRGRGGSGARAGPPPPAWPLRDTPRPAAGHLRARHVLPPVLLPRTPPRAGGGNGRPRRDSASQAAAGSGGGAGRGGKERATRCVAQRSSGQSVPPRGAWRGRGGREESAPQDGREGPRGPSGAGGGGAGAGRRAKGLSLGAAWGPRAVSANFNQRSGPGAPREPEPPGPCPGSRGRARCWRGGFRSLLPCHPRRRRAAAFHPRQCLLRTSLKVTTLFFSLQPSIFLETKLGVWPGWAGPGALNPHIYLSILAGCQPPSPASTRLNHCFFGTGGVFCWVGIP